MSDAPVAKTIVSSGPHAAPREGPSIVHDCHRSATGWSEIFFKVKLFSM